MTRLMLQYTLLLMILGSEFAANSGEPSPQGRYTGPHSLGPYSVDRDVSMKSLLAAFGVKPEGKYTYCLADKEHGLYLYIQSEDDLPGRVANVLLSSFPNCKHLPVFATTIDPMVWRTPEGIGIGSTKEEVLHVYHKPVFIKKLDKRSDLGVIAGIHDAGASQTSVGDSSYLYSCLLTEREVCSDDLRATRMGFGEDKLIWIRLSNSE